MRSFDCCSGAHFAFGLTLELGANITVCMQDFPYHFEKGVEHHNIWCTVPLPEPEVLQVGRQIHHFTLDVKASQQGPDCGCVPAGHPAKQTGV